MIYFIIDKSMATLTLHKSFWPTAVLLIHTNAYSNYPPSISSKHGLGGRLRRMSYNDQYFRRGLRLVENHDVRYSGGGLCISSGNFTYILIFQLNFALHTG